MHQRYAGRWEPITIRLTQGIPRIFKDAEDALSFLEVEWPHRTDFTYLRAIRACRAALEGRESIEVARLEFELACIEGGLVPINIRRGDLGRILRRRR